ncbi:MAG: hypothetical protein II744_08385 [Eubacterium sp.]|nr:hypothetical protein [Eubacterium sp.]
MYNYNLSGADAALVGKILLFSLVCIVASLAVRLLFALAVNHDAKAIGVKNKTLWSVLEFFFPLIIGIIYLCVRNSLEKTVPRYCTSCGATMPPNTKACYNCGSTMLLDFNITGAEQEKKSRKNCIIAGVVIYVVLFIGSQIFGISLVTDIIRQYDKPRDFGSYEDYFEDYFEDFGKYFEQYGQEENPADDNSEFFDDFNNFGEGEENEEPTLPDNDPFGFFDNNGN